MIRNRPKQLMNSSTVTSVQQHMPRPPHALSPNNVMFQATSNVVARQRAEQRRKELKERTQFYALWEPWTNIGARERAARDLGLKDANFIVRQVAGFFKGFQEIAWRIVNVTDPATSVTSLFRTLGDSLDWASLVIKAPIYASIHGIPLSEAFKKAYGFTDEGRYLMYYSELNQDIDAIPDNFFINMAAEVLLDPANWITFGAKAGAGMAIKKATKGMDAVQIAEASARGTLRSIPKEVVAAVPTDAPNAVALIRRLSEAVWRKDFRTFQRTVQENIGVLKLGDTVNMTTIRQLFDNSVRTLGTKQLFRAMVKIDQLETAMIRSVKYISPLHSVAKGGKKIYRGITSIGTERITTEQYQKFVNHLKTIDTDKHGKHYSLEDAQKYLKKLNQDINGPDFLKQADEVISKKLDERAQIYNYIQGLKLEEARAPLSERASALTKQIDEKKSKVDELKKQDANNPDIAVLENEIELLEMDKAGALKAAKIVSRAEMRKKFMILNTEDRKIKSILFHELDQAKAKLAELEKGSKSWLKLSQQIQKTEALSSLLELAELSEPHRNYIMSMFTLRENILARRFLLDNTQKHVQLGKVEYDAAIKKIQSALGNVETATQKELLQMSEKVLLDEAQAIEIMEKHFKRFLFLDRVLEREKGYEAILSKENLEVHAILNDKYNKLDEKVADIFGTFIQKMVALADETGKSISEEDIYREIRTAVVRDFLPADTAVPFKANQFARRLIDSLTKSGTAHKYLEYDKIKEKIAQVYPNPLYLKDQVNIHLDKVKQSIIDNRPFTQAEWDAVDFVYDITDGLHRFKKTGLRVKTKEGLLHRLEYLQFVEDGYVFADALSDINRIKKVFVNHNFVEIKDGMMVRHDGAAPLQKLHEDMYIKFQQLEHNLKRLKRDDVAFSASKGLYERLFEEKKLFSSFEERVRRLRESELRIKNHLKERKITKRQAQSQLENIKANNKKASQSKIQHQDNIKRLTTEFEQEFDKEFKNVFKTISGFDTKSDIFNSLDDLLELDYTQHRIALANLIDTAKRKKSDTSADVYNASELASVIKAQLKKQFGIDEKLLGDFAFDEPNFVIGLMVSMNKKAQRRTVTLYNDFLDTHKQISEIIDQGLPDFSKMAVGDHPENHITSIYKYISGELARKTGKGFDERGFSLEAFSELLSKNKQLYENTYNLKGKVFSQKGFAHVLKGLLLRHEWETVAKLSKDYMTVDLANPVFRNLESEGGEIVSNVLYTIMNYTKHGYDAQGRLIKNGLQTHDYVRIINSLSGTNKYARFKGINTKDLHVAATMKAIKDIEALSPEELSVYIDDYINHEMQRAMRQFNEAINFYESFMPPEEVQALAGKKSVFSRLLAHDKYDNANDGPRLMIDLGIKSIRGSAMKGPAIKTLSGADYVPDLKRNLKDAVYIQTDSELDRIPGTDISQPFQYAVKIRRPDGSVETKNFWLQMRDEQGNEMQLGEFIQGFTGVRNEDYMNFDRLSPEQFKQELKALVDAEGENVILVAHNSAADIDFFRDVGFLYGDNMPVLDTVPMMRIMLAEAKYRIKERSTWVKEYGEATEVVDLETQLKRFESLTTVKQEEIARALGDEAIFEQMKENIAGELGLKTSTVGFHNAYMDVEVLDYLLFENKQIGAEGILNSFLNRHGITRLEQLSNKNVGVLDATDKEVLSGLLDELTEALGPVPEGLTEVEARLRDSLIKQAHTTKRGHKVASKETLDRKKRILNELEHKRDDIGKTGEVFSDEATEPAYNLLNAKDHFDRYERTVREIQDELSKAGEEIDVYKVLMLMENAEEHKVNFLVESAKDTNQVSGYIQGLEPQISLQGKGPTATETMYLKGPEPKPGFRPGQRKEQADKIAEYRRLKKENIGKKGDFTTTQMPFTLYVTDSHYPQTNEYVAAIDDKLETIKRVLDVAVNKENEILDAFYGTGTGTIAYSKMASHFMINDAWMQNTQKLELMNMFYGIAQGNPGEGPALVASNFARIYRQALKQYDEINQTSYFDDSLTGKVLFDRFREILPNDPMVKFVDRVEQIDKHVEIQNEIWTIFDNLIRKADPTDYKNLKKIRTTAARFYDFMQQVDKRIEYMTRNPADRADIDPEHVYSELIAILDNSKDMPFLRDEMLVRALRKNLEDLNPSENPLHIFSKYVRERIDKIKTTPHTPNHILLNPDTDFTNEFYLDLKSATMDYLADHQKQMLVKSGPEKAAQIAKEQGVPYDALEIDARDLVTYGEAHRHLEETVRDFLESIRQPLRDIKNVKYDHGIIRRGQFREDLQRLLELNSNKDHGDPYITEAFEQITSETDLLYHASNYVFMKSQATRQATRKASKAYYFLDGLTKAPDSATPHFSNLKQDNETSRFVDRLMEIVLGEGPTGSDPVDPYEILQFAKHNIGKRTVRLIRKGEELDNLFAIAEEQGNEELIKIHRQLKKLIESHTKNPFMDFKDDKARVLFENRVKATVYDYLTTVKPEKYRNALNELYNNGFSKKDLFRNKVTAIKQTSEYLNDSYRSIRSLFESPKEFLNYLKNNKDLSVMVIQPDEGLEKGARITRMRVNTVEDVLRLDKMMQEFAPGQGIVPLGIGTTNTFNTLSKVLKQNFKFKPGSPQDVIRRFLLMPLKGISLMNAMFFPNNLTEATVKNLVSQDGGIFSPQTVLKDMWRAMKMRQVYLDEYHEMSKVLSFSVYGDLPVNKQIEAYVGHLKSKGLYNTDKAARIQAMRFVNEFSGEAAAMSMSNDFLIKVREGVIGKGKEDSKIEKAFNKIFYGGKYSPFSWNLRVNSEVEMISRLALHLNDLSKGISRNESLQRVLFTHFDYGTKTQAEMYAEFVIPFVSFPLRALDYWSDFLFESGQTARILSKTVLTAWGPQTIEDNDYAQYQASRGRLAMGDHVFQVAMPWADAAGTAGTSQVLGVPDMAIRKLNPFIRAGIIDTDLSAGERALRLPLASTGQNITNIFSNPGDLNATPYFSPYFRGSFNTLRTGFSYRHPHMSRSYTQNLPNITPMKIRDPAGAIQFKRATVKHPIRYR